MLKSLIPILVFVFIACAKEDNGPTPEIISNTSVTGIAGTVATFGGNVIWMDGFTIMKKGICFATTSKPSIKNSVSNSTAVPGPYTCKLSGLKLNTTYYARAYATYSSGLTIYGKIVSFTTTNELSMLKTSIESLSKYTATLKDSIFSDGGLEILKRGVCYGTSTQPTYEGALHTSDGRGPGKFLSVLNNLSGHTTYYVRPYVTNSVGIIYGEEISFTTPGAIPGDPITDYDGNTYQTLILGNQTWMGENLRVTHFRNGDAIPHFSATYYNEVEPIYQTAYNNNEQTVASYGRFYTWFVGIDSRKVAPEGWHIPSYQEFETLVSYLRSEGYSIPKALCSKTNWTSSTVVNSPGYKPETNNNSDFNAVPLGVAYGSNNFEYVGQDAVFLTTDISITTTSDGNVFTSAKIVDLYYVYSNFTYWGLSKSSGFPIRCIKD